MALSAVYIGRWVHQYFRHRSQGGNLANIYAALSDYSPSETAAATQGGAERAAETEPAAGDEDDTPGGVPLRERLLLSEARGRERFAEFLEINEDFRGMIIIDSLGIKEPYVHYSDNDKYLNIDFYGNRSSYGTIFLNTHNDPLLTDRNIVLFGHHMRAQEMFTPLTRYRSPEVVRDGGLIVLDSLTGRTQWLVFAAYTCEPDYGYINTTVQGEQFEELLSEIMMRSLVITNIDITADDQILTLSTCDYAFEDARFAVHARKLRPGEELPENLEVSANPNPKPFDVPMQRPLAEAVLNSAAVMRHITSGRTYFYFTGESGIEWYTGNLYNVQGPYNCFAGTATTSGYLSAVMTASRRVYMAADGWNGQPGITLLSSNLPSGRFSIARSPVTPEGLDARWPYLYFDGEAMWLLYTVQNEETAQSFIYVVQMEEDGALYEPRVAAVFPEGDYRAAGFVITNGRALVLVHDRSRQVLLGKYIGQSWDGVEQEPAVLSLAGDYTRVTFYGGLTDSGVRFVQERGGRAYPGTFDISEIPIPEFAAWWQGRAANSGEDEGSADGDGDEANGDENTDGDENGENPDGGDEYEGDGAENGDADETDGDNSDGDIDAGDGDESGAGVDDNTEGGDTTEPPPPLEGTLAVPVDPRIIIGTQIYRLWAYNINGFNYFNLRDVATLLADTPGAFDISFSDGQVVIIPGGSYTGSGLSATDENEKTAYLSQTPIVVEGSGRVLSAYNIDDSNYVGMRDLARVLGFTVSTRGDVIVVEFD